MDRYEVEDLASAVARGIVADEAYETRRAIQDLREEILDRLDSLRFRVEGLEEKING